MVGREEHLDLQQLIQEGLREADTPTPDENARRRMRAQVMGRLRPHRPTLRDNAWATLWHLSRPAPYIVRSVAAIAIVLCAGMGATVASADALPDDALYPVKIASEGVRLALAASGDARAAVELTIAEHRLAEAETLAAGGRTSDALVASAAYSEHIASAAAELAPRADSVAVNARLESSFNAQRERAHTLATILSLDARSAQGGQILAMIASPKLAPGRTRIERIAETAASVAADLADAADGAMAEHPSSQAVNATPRRAGEPKASAKASARASNTARAARSAANKARASADKLNRALKEREREHEAHSDRD